MTLDNEEASIIDRRQCLRPNRHHRHRHGHARHLRAARCRLVAENQAANQRRQYHPLADRARIVDRADRASAPELEYRKRTINTSVLVGDGNIIVLGGLAERERTRKQFESAVSRRFARSSGGCCSRANLAPATTSNLVVFLRPRVISSEEVSRELSQQLYEEILRQEAGESIIESLDIHEALVGSDEANEVDESDAAPVFESDAAPASESESTPE